MMANQPDPGPLRRLFAPLKRSWERVRENPAADFALGLTPFGAVADVQDFGAAAKSGDALGMGLAAAGLIPGAGDLLKGGGRMARQAMRQEDAPRLATLFSGAGTMEAGLQGNAEKVFSAEYNPRNVEHYNRAFGRSTRPINIMELDPEEIAQTRPDLLHSSPVCTHFSCANKTPGEVADDLRAAQAVVQAIQRVQPNAVSIENVPRYQQSESFQDIILPALRREGYNIDQGVYNAADLGGIQDRSRLIVRGVREGNLPEIPGTVPRKDWLTGIQDLLGNAPESRVPQWEMDRLNAMADRGSIDLSQPVITMGGSAGRTVAHARNPGGPAPTLKAANEVPRILLPGEQGRRVTPEMMRRLMGLPDDYPLPENYFEAKRILGQGMEGNMTRALIEPLLRRP